MTGNEERGARRPRRTWRRQGALALLGVAACVLAVAGCGSSQGSSGGSGKGKLKVAVVYNGPLQDDYDKGMQQGIADAIDRLGRGHFELTEVKSVPYSEQLTQIITQLFAQGNDAVIDGMGGSGSLFYNGCKQQLAKKCISYYPTPISGEPANTWGYYSQYWKAFYLEGVAAGRLTRTDTVGWVGSFEGPSDNSVMNSFLLGCQSVDKRCRARVIYVNSYFDPPKAREAAVALMNAGADVINGYHDDATVVKVAQSRNGWGFGIYRPMGQFGRDAYVTSWLLAPPVSAGVEQGLKSMLDGTFRSSFAFVSPGGQDGSLPLDAWGARVPQAVRDEVSSVWQQMQHGKNVFAGPIRDTTGRVRVAAGTAMDDRYIYDQWNWQVQGVLR